MKIFQQELTVDELEIVKSMIRGGVTYDDQIEKMLKLYRKSRDIRS